MPSGVRDTTAFVGFFIYISSIAILGIHRDSWYSLLDFTPGLYATWALVPKAILDLIGLSYLPNRYSLAL